MQKMNYLRTVPSSYLLQNSFSFQKIYVNRINSYGYNDSNVGGGGKIHPLPFFVLFYSDRNRNNIKVRRLRMCINALGVLTVYYF